MLTDADRSDAYRAVYPDAGADEGRTWSPLPTERLIARTVRDLRFRSEVLVHGLHELPVARG